MENNRMDSKITKNHFQKAIFFPLIWVVKLDIKL
jgi:hypothetical protein